MKPVQDLEQRIVLDPHICGGRPTIRGTRIAARTILEFLAAGDDEAEILAAYPQLAPEDIRACLQFAAGLMDRRYSVERVA